VNFKAGISQAASIFRWKYLPPLLFPRGLYLYTAAVASEAVQHAVFWHGAVPAPQTSAASSFITALWPAPELPFVQAHFFLTLFFLAVRLTILSSERKQSWNIFPAGMVIFPVSAGIFRTFPHNLPKTE
jgi:hypothetical protein